jgi:hypothetical protein
MTPRVDILLLRGVVLSDPSMAIPALGFKRNSVAVQSIIQVVFDGYYQGCFSTGLEWVQRL